MSLAHEAPKSEINGGMQICRLGHRLSRRPAHPWHPTSVVAAHHL